VALPVDPSAGSAASAHPAAVIFGTD